MCSKLDKIKDKAIYDNGEVLGLDGLNHGLWQLFGVWLSAVITWFLARNIVFNVALVVHVSMMLMWFYFEYNQEKKMVDNKARGHPTGNHLKPWKYSKARLKDVGWPLLLGTMSLFLIYGIFK